jgi:hypothetical protein
MVILGKRLYENQNKNKYSYFILQEEATSQENISKTTPSYNRNTLFKPRFCSWLQNLPEGSDETKFV